jgi:uncharacterized protein
MRGSNDSDSAPAGSIRRDIAPLLLNLAAQYPVVTLTGPRQSGKSTLARSAFPGLPLVSLEDPDLRRFALDDPRGFFATHLPDGGIVDEVQRAPELPSWLQGMVDADPRPGRWVLTGSQQFELMHRVTQSLAGRTAVLRLLPFTWAETVRLRPAWRSVGLGELLLSGFYPRLHDRRLDPTQALGDYFATYVERDLRQLSAVHDLQRFERFVRLAAGRCGQLLNLASLGNDAGVSQPTARAWMDLLQTCHIVHLLPPWFANIGKRLVKSPKLYFCDVGLACWLLGLRTPEQVMRDPLFGALFENFIVIEALKDRWNLGEHGPLYFYRDAKGHEVDLLLPQGREMHAIEVKAGATVASDWFDGLQALDRAVPGLLASGQVLYGGERHEARSRWPVLGWRRLAAGR